MPRSRSGRRPSGCWPIRMSICCCLTYMVAFDYLDLDEVLTALVQRPATQHVIITGRGCHRALLELADTVSEVKNVKHAFDAGIKAQKGIDW